MTSAAVTANELIQTLEARLLAQKTIQRVVDGTRARFRAVYYGRKLAKALVVLNEGLRKRAREGRFDMWPDDQFASFTDDVAKLYLTLRSTNEQVRDAGMDKMPVHWRYFITIENQTEVLGDILESFRLGQDEDFKRLTVEAVRGLSAQ
jgi:hypothetical protein